MPAIMYSLVAEWYANPVANAPDPVDFLRKRALTDGRNVIKKDKMMHDKARHRAEEANVMEDSLENIVKMFSG
jgi:hypothetical protein